MADTIKVVSQLTLRYGDYPGGPEPIDEPFKSRGFPWLAAKQEVRTPKHERDSTHHCWLEEGKGHVLRNFKELRAAPCQQPARDGTSVLKPQEPSDANN